MLIGDGRPLQSTGVSAISLAQVRNRYRVRMRGAGDQFSVGERISFNRRRRGLTQGVLAGLVGRSEDWLSKIERGERPVRRLDVLSDLARALRVTIGDLLGQPVLVEDGHARGDDDVPAVRDALMSPRRLSRVLFDGPVAVEVRPDPVRQLVENAWTDYQRGRLGQVIRMLPGLIEGAQYLEDSTAAAEPGGGGVWAVSARVHHLAATTLAKIGEADLAWMSAERAMYAADQVDDPLVLASAARAGTHALLAVGRYDDALTLGVTAARWLQGLVREHDPAALSLAGMLYLRSAIASARHQDRATTSDLLRRADEAAALLGEDANYWQTGFRPTNVRLHRVSAALDLGDIEYVVRQAEMPRPASPPLPVERAVAHRIDLARALSLVARDDEALSQLLQAEEQAPELVRHSATVRESVRAMHRRAPASAGKSSSLLGLAERCRAVQ